MKKANIKVSNEFLKWQKVILQCLLSNFEENEFKEDCIARVVDSIKEEKGIFEGMDDKQIKKKIMPFTKFKMEQVNFKF